MITCEHSTAFIKFVVGQERIACAEVWPSRQKWKSCGVLQVGEALHERAQRVYERYGNVMLDIKGMTKAGVDRKAACRQLFSKMLYLAGGLPACLCK